MLNKKMIACKLITTLDIYLRYMKQDEPVILSYCIGLANGYLTALEDEALADKLIKADVATSIEVANVIITKYRCKC